MIMTPQQSKLMHEHYLNLRKMLKAGFSRRGVQKSFEELAYSVLGKDSWRPTHISESALKSYCNGEKRLIQRAHGVVPDRLDRIDRTMLLMEGPELSFHEWWDFFTRQDKTILITKQEHNKGVKYTLEDLVPLPDWRQDMFENSGFSVKIRKKTEGVWLENTYKKLCAKQKDKDIKSATL